MYNPNGSMEEPKDDLSIASHKGLSRVENNPTPVVVPLSGTLRGK